MILMLAPAPNLNLGAQPSGASYVSDYFGLVKIVNDSAADQVALQAAGCFTLTPFGGWGNYGFLTLADLYAADSGAILPGITGFPQFTVASVFADGASANDGTWAKTGTGNGAGAWTQVSLSTLAALAEVLANLQTQVDAIPATMHWAAGGSVVAATTAALPANTYVNGTAGVGATLTATANGALTTQDGVILTSGARLLVKNEVAAAHNGVYVVTQVGGAGTPYILTRATDANGGAALSGLNVLVAGGATQAGQIYVLPAPTSLTVGTSALNFSLLQPSLPTALGAGLIGAASQEAALAVIGASRVVGLEVYAQPLGIDLTLDGVDITAAVNAATAAMQASAALGGLYVRIPPGRFLCQQFKLYNRSGWFCDAGTVVLDQVVANPAAPVPFFTLGDPYATGVVIDGFILRGGWTYGRGAYSGAPETDPWLFKYPASITSNSYPDTGAQVGQACVNLQWAFSGVDDAQYITNSVGGVQVPNAYVANLRAYGFGGDLFYFGGAGANIVHNLTGQTCGGRGLVINGYDSHFTMIDVGGCGLENVVLYANGSELQVLNVKGWYGGTRLIAGHQQACRLWKCGGVVMTGDFQDATGQLFQGEDCSACTITANLDWQGQISTMLTDNAAVELIGNVQYNKFNFTISRVDTYSPHPDCLKVLRLTANSDGTPQLNQFAITHSGFENDIGIWNDEWLAEVGGARLNNNDGLVNSARRQPRQYIPGSDSRYTWGLLGPGYAVGLDVNNLNAQYPGMTLIGGFGNCTLNFADDTTTKAGGVLTATANFADGEAVLVGPKTFTMRGTLPSPGADGDVKLGATLAASLTNLANAVNVFTYVAGVKTDAGVRGTDYSWRTTQLLNFVAGATATTLTITAASGGSWANATATTTTAAHASWGGATLGAQTAGADNSGVIYKTAIGWNATGLGFFGAAPIAQPNMTFAVSAIADATTRTAIAGLVNLLASLGLAENSTT